MELAPLQLGPRATGPLETGWAAAPHAEELEQLLRLAERLLCAQDAAGVGALLVDAVVATYGFSRGVAMASPDGRLEVLAGHGLLSLAGDHVRPEASAAVAAALAGGATVEVRGLDPDAEPWLAEHFPAGVDLLVVPIVTEGRRYGALLLQVPVLREPAWRRASTGAIERATGCAASTLRTHWRVEQLERLASTDDLTLIANRRAFWSALVRELARSARSDQPVSLVMVDLDDFKAVNDVHGHPAGDDALRKVAAALSEASRDLDTAARYGGEEFAVILPDCSPEQSLEIAARLRIAVAGVQAVVPLTASAGVATFPVHAGDVEGLVRAADDALLVSKRSGRNRVTQATLMDGQVLDLDAAWTVDSLS